MTDNETESKRIRIDEANMSVRSMNVLYRYGYNFTYLDELKEITSEDLMSHRNVGRATLREIRKVLSIYGMALKNDILCDTDAEKRLIQDLPRQIKEIEYILRDIERRVRWISDLLDQLHCNMQPLEKK